MAEVFKIPIKGVDMDFHCGTYATEKTLEALNISLSDIEDAVNRKYIPTIRHFIFFSAMDAQRLKTPKGEAIDFPYNPDDVYDWIDDWGGGNSDKIVDFTKKLFVSLFGKIEPEQKKSPTKAKAKK